MCLNKAAKARRFADARHLVNEHGATWADAFKLASGGRVNGDDYESYIAYRANLNESPYLLGRPCRAFD